MLNVTQAPVTGFDIPSLPVRIIRAPVAFHCERGYEICHA
jgi:hypothetical protein